MYKNLEEENINNRKKSKLIKILLFINILIGIWYYIFYIIPLTKTCNKNFKPALKNDTCYNRTHEENLIYGNTAIVNDCPRNNCEVLEIGYVIILLTILIISLGISYCIIDLLLLLCTCQKKSFF